MYERGMTMGIAVIALLMAAGVAGAAVYKNYRPAAEAPVEKTAALGEGGAFVKPAVAASSANLQGGQQLPWHGDQQQAQQAPVKRVAQQPVKPACNDGNILGYAAGGVAGGVLGHQIGKGKGNTAATIGGVLGGAYLGGQHIPLQNATCRR